jgi:hypothetical protein
MERLTKNEWEKKILAYHADVLGKPIPIDELAFWWYRTGHSGMRLEKPGFNRFVQAGVQFNKYNVKVEQWFGSITIGLSRMPCPYYIEPTAKYSMEYEFYLPDEEYAMMFMFMDNNLTMFAKGFMT